MLIKKMVIGLIISITAVLMAACTPSTDPITVTRVAENEVTRETTPPTAEPNDSIEVTRPAPDPTATAEPTPVPQPTAADVQTFPAPAQDGITFNGYLTEDIPTLDPQLSDDVVSRNYIENLFVSLTNYDPVTAEVVPEAAESWEMSQDGLLYIFHLRTDIPWVYHNPVTGETTQAIDYYDNPRFVTAHDFVYATRRMCDPNLNTYWNSIVSPLIVGCDEVVNAIDPNNIPEEQINAIGVSAPDDSTLIIELNAPAAYFLSMTPMWNLAATPEWIITRFGRDWIEAGTIVTSGPYVLHEWVHSLRVTLHRNPLMPQDMRGTGNIETHIVNIVPDAETGYALWVNNEVDYTEVPPTETGNHLKDFANETIQVPDLAVFYFGFRMTKPPFDDAHVRRAFSAAFDRQKLIDLVYQGNGLPMKHFAPPGIFGAPPIDEIGVGFNPEFARTELEAAGYPNCEGFPQISLTAYSGQSTFNWVEFAQEQWEEHLGCSPDLIIFEQMAFSELLVATANDTEDDIAAHMYTLGWGPDYTDENNWVSDVLSCEYSQNRSKRTCNEIDDLIIEAREEPDRTRRIELYAQIEEAFFGPEGEFPIMPLWVRTNFRAVHSWYNYTPIPFFGDQWYNDSIDMEAKQVAWD